MRRSPRSHNLTEIAPHTWSNGHLLFRPIYGRNCLAWDIVLAGNPAGSPVAHIRYNSIWREYALLTRSSFVFAHDCLADTSQLLATLNAAYAPLQGLLPTSRLDVHAIGKGTRHRSKRRNQCDVRHTTALETGLSPIDLAHR